MSPLSVLFHDSVLRQAGEARVPHVEVWSAQGCAVAVWSVVNQVAGCALRLVLVGQEPGLLGQ